MADEDRDDVLLSDTNEAPEGLTAGEPARRKRGRPKASTSGGAAKPAERLAGVNEMADVLSKLIGLTSAILAFAIVGADYAKAVAMTGPEARDIAEPAARLLRKSRLARQASALVTRGGDTVALVSALAGYLMRAGPMVAEIHAQKVGMSSGHLGASQVIRALPPTGQPGAAQPASNGHSAAGPNAFAGFSDADANAANTFAGWNSADLEAAFRAATSN